MNHMDKIALVGMACRFPEANSVNEFWHNLLKGHISTKKVRHWPDGSTTTSGFIDNPNCFDAAFFNISPKEAQCMSPQLRQLLEVSYQAIESSGLTINDLKTLNTGVFCTSLPGDYKNLLAQDKQAATNPYSFSGNAFSAISGRLSYYYDFHGPSISIDTACSSGLSALHLARLSIKNGDCDAALVGGASVFSTQEFHSLALSSQMLSKTNECAAFDEKADGFVASEGVVCLVLISEQKANELGLPIYGLIKEINLNHNGLSNGLMAPNAKQQELLIRKTYQKSGLSLEDIALFETHGTATKMGDSIEMRSLVHALPIEQTTSDCYLGACKMVIGHTLVCSALASVIKTALSYYYQTIPPNPLFKTINPLIKAPEQLILNNQPISWPKNKHYASISAYGFTGSNGHLIMEFIEKAQEMPFHHYQNFYLFSAASIASLNQKILDLDDWLNNNPTCNLNALSLKLMRHSLSMKYRLAIYAEDLDQLKDCLHDRTCVVVCVSDKTIFNIKKERNSSQIHLIMRWLADKNVSWGLEQTMLSNDLLPPYPFEAIEYNIQQQHNQLVKSLQSPETLQLCVNILCEVLSYQKEQLDVHKSLAELGIDSLTALSLLNKLKEHGFMATIDKVWQAKSVLAFSEALTPSHNGTPLSHLTIDIPGMNFNKKEGLTWISSSNKSKTQLILLPPLNSDYKAWLRQIPLLLKCNYQVHIPYYPGHDLQTLAEPLSLHKLAKKIADFAYSLDEKPHFIGWSLGGVLSLLIALNHQEIIKSLSLIACTTQFDEHLFEKTVEMQKDLQNHSDLLKISFQTEQSITDYISCKTPMNILKDYYQELINLSITQQELAEVNVPTQIILGKQDPVINEQQIEDLKILPQQKICIFEQAGHFIPITFAAEFNQLLIAFITSNQ